MNTDKIIRYNFLAQNLYSLKDNENRIRQALLRNPNILKAAEADRINHDAKILEKELQRLHRDVFEDLQDELGCEFKFLLTDK